MVETASVAVHVTLGGSDMDDVDVSAASLAGRLREIDRVTVTREPEVAPPDTRAGVVDALGVLIVSLPAQKVLLTRALNLLGSWMEARGDRTVSIEIDGDHMVMPLTTPEERAAIVETFLRRHAT
jgi:hypothetical protein